MSQQINLILPELRPRFDWLGLPVVLSAAFVGLLIIIASTGMVGQRVNYLATQEAQLKTRLQALQQQSKEMGVALGARKGDASLPERIEELRLAVEQRQDAMKALGQGREPGEAGFSESLRAFSRQVVEGVWLTAFSLSGKNIEIRGRLTEPSLLPAYIKRLNGESAFAGRRFEALDMKGELPQIDSGAAATAGTASRPTRPFTEFSLRSDAMANKERAR